MVAFNDNDNVVNVLLTDRKTEKKKYTHYPNICIIIIDMLHDTGVR